MPNREKALGQFKLQVVGLLGIFNAYGQGVYIEEVAEQITILALQLHERLSGKDIPIGPSNGRSTLGIQRD